MQARWSAAARPVSARPARAPRRRRLGLGLAAMVATTAIGVAGILVAAPGSARTTTAAPAATLEFPSGTAFFTPPSPLPAGAPGDVIRWRRTTIGALGGLVAPAKADAYQIMYLSTSTAGARIAITGTVFVPRGRSLAGMPIIGYAPSTHGTGDPCAASRELVTGSDTDLININDALTRGWAVVDGDYEGLGTPGEHTYVVGRAEAHSVLDSVRAAQRLAVAGLPKAGPVGLWGYSQGGGAVAWAAQLAASYAPELRIKGTSAGGTPADLAVVAKALDGGPGFAYLLMAATGLDAAYPELRLSGYLNAAGRTALVDLRTTCVNQALVAYAFKRIPTFVTRNPLDTPAWTARVAEQKLGLIRPSAPVFLYHGMQDEFLPYSQAVQLRKDWCARGARVRFGTFLGDHISTFLAGQIDAQTYLADRFAGRPAPSSC